MNNAIQLLTSCLLLASFFFILEKRLNIKRLYSWILITGSLLLLLYTPPGKKLITMTTTLTGELSITSYALLLFFILTNTFHWKTEFHNNKKRFYGFISIVGLIFYTFSLGFSSFDPYRFGYQPVTLSILISVIALTLIIFKQYFLGLLLTLALVAYAYPLLNSNNLFDYLLDPFLFVFSSFVFTLSLFKRNKQSLTNPDRDNPHVPG